MKDDNGDADRQVERFLHEQQLFGSREGGRDRRQLFEGDVGRQGGIQRQHGRHDAVGQQAFRLITDKTWKRE